MNKPKIFGILLFAYTLSLAFQDFMRLSGVMRKLQLPEILFLLMLVFFPYNYLRQYRFQRNDVYLLASLGVYWLANVVSSVASGQFSAVAESVGRLYLIVLFGMATLYFSQLTKEQIKQYSVKASLWLGILLSTTAILGLVAQLCGFPNTLVGSSEDYPYFGNVYRVQGMTHTPAMLVSLLSFTIMLSFTEGYKRWQRWSYIAVFFMLITAILTLTRSAIFAFWGVFMLLIFKKWNFSKRIFLSTAVAVTLFMTIGTHFIFISKNNPALPNLYNSIFISNKILYQQGDYLVLETCYLSMKRSALVIWQTNPIIGIGTGNFVEHNTYMQKIGVYPAKLPVYEAHSTYLGTLAENGIFAAIAVIFLFGLLARQIICFGNVQNDLFATALLLCLTSVFIEGIALDTMNFRHYWLLFALVWAYARKTGPLSIEA